MSPNSTPTHDFYAAKKITKCPIIGKLGLIVHNLNEYFGLESMYKYFVVIFVPNLNNFFSSFYIHFCQNYQNFKKTEEKKVKKSTPKATRHKK